MINAFQSIPEWLTNSGKAQQRRVIRGQHKAISLVPLEGYKIIL